MARFTIPRDLYFGKGALEELKKTLKGTRKLLCFQVVLPWKNLVS